VADFCYDCARDHLGIEPELNDMKNLVPEGEFAEVLCEGCGWIIVDHNGKRIDEECND
jgi:hypothetical protein